MAGPLVYCVFSQRPDTRLDVEACDAQARRFFGASLTRGDGPDVLVLAASGQPGAERTVRARTVSGEDRSLAAAAEARVGGGGLELLARRCKAVWEVERKGTADDAALRIAAILASVLLGPIVDAGGPEIFGVKTAREKLDRGAASR